MSSFQYFEFVPRREFRDACENWLSRIQANLPVDATFRAAVTKVKNGYYFSFYAKCSIGDFESEVFLDETFADRTRRDWQCVALVHLERAVGKKLQKWMTAKDIGPAHMVQGMASQEDYDTTITRKAG